MGQTLSKSDERDLARIQAIGEIVSHIETTPIGDLFIELNKIFDQFEDPGAAHCVESLLKDLRDRAAAVKAKDKFFINPPTLQQKLTDEQFLQLVAVEMSIAELCYACEMVQYASNLTSGWSTGTRFYLKSIYYYTSSLFLVDAQKKTHKGLPMGGSVILALDPINLGWILDPIKKILDEPFGDITFGDAIRRERNRDLVHGDFSLENAKTEELIQQTWMRKQSQMDRFSQMILRLFHRVIILDLQLMSLLDSSGMETKIVMQRYTLKKLSQI